MVGGGEKLLLFGGLPHEYLKGWEITSDIKLSEEKLGVRFEEVPTEELASYKKFRLRDEVFRLARDVMRDDSIEGWSIDTSYLTLRNCI
jgi:hypothetical protein